MCGIVGYIGGKEAQPVLLSGLKRLEYRGYDSSGIAIISSKNNIEIRKSPGKIRELEKLLKNRPLCGMAGIAHTRWATHGAPTQINAHPHQDCRGKIAVVHNGIIENYEALKEKLTKEGHFFRSQTDTEVIVHLIEKFYRGIPLEDAVAKALKMLSGSFAIGVVAAEEPDKLVGARRGSPLIVGLGNGENFLASDVPAVLGFTKKVIFLGENEMAVLSKKDCRILGLDLKHIPKEVVPIRWDIGQAEKMGFEHFMLKEINEQPGILEHLINSRIKKKTGQIYFQEQNIPKLKLRGIKN
ncbi:MAG: class II glutamine amidotransferase, partial [Candidatus Omnitrophica bacterium]|nr:class II glutamine amidotransferase [Candidatus Omnitrophota bacterium]